MTAALLYLRLNLNALEQFIHLIIAQLLTQARQNISQLSCTNVTVSVLVKDLETSDELVGCSCRFEAVRSVKDVEERVVVDIFGRGVGKVCYFGLSRVLTESSKEITKGLAGDGASTLLVEESEGFFVFCVGL